jgi:hypothetical protein
MEPITATELLKNYGPWAVIVLEAILATGVVTKLWQALQSERAKRDADSKGFHMAMIQNVRDAEERARAFNETIRTIARR